MTPHLLILAGLIALPGCGLDVPADAAPAAPADTTADPTAGPGDPDARAAWARNRALWGRTRPARYSVAETVSCECNPPYDFTALVGPAGVDSVAIDPERAAVWRAAFGDVYTYQDALSRAMTVDAAFARIEEGLRRADHVWIEYDSTYGYPTSLSINWSREIADEEDSRTFSDLRPLP